MIDNSVRRVIVWHLEALPSDKTILSRGSLFGILRLCRVIDNSTPRVIVWFLAALPSDRQFCPEGHCLAS